MKVISMTTGKTGPEIIKALGTWAATALGGFEQLQSEADSMEQLKEGFMWADDDLADDEPAELDSACDTADMVSAAAASNGSDALVVTKEPDVNVAMSDDKLVELHQKLKSSTAAAPELRHHLVSQLHIAAGIVERLQSTSACGLAHPAAASLTQRQDGLNNSLVRLVSFVEHPVGKRGKPAQAAKLMQLMRLHLLLSLSPSPRSTAWIGTGFEPFPNAQCYSAKHADGRLVGMPLHLCRFAVHTGLQ